MKLYISILSLAFTLATIVKAMVIPDTFSLYNCGSTIINVVDNCLKDEAVFYYTIGNGDCNEVEYACVYPCNDTDYSTTAKSLDGSTQGSSLRRLLFTTNNVNYCESKSNIYFCQSDKTHFDYKSCLTYLETQMIAITDPIPFKTYSSTTKKVLTTTTKQLPSTSTTKQLPSTTATKHLPSKTSEITEVETAVIPEEEVETTVIQEVPEVPEVPEDEITVTPEIPEVPNDEIPDIVESPDVVESPEISDYEEAVDSDIEEDPTIQEVPEVPVVAPNPPAGPPPAAPAAPPVAHNPPSHPVPPPFPHYPAPPVAAPSSCGSQGAQCGGINYKGPNCCEEGLVCAEVNKFFQACVKLVE